MPELASPDTVGAMRFFVVSGQRTGGELGRFNGVIGVAIAPGHFSEFYSKLARGGNVFALVRADGAVLARWPENAAGDQPVPGVLTEAIARDPEGGLFTAASRLDGAERRTGYRRVPGYPLYVAAGKDTSALAADFRLQQPADGGERQRERLRRFAGAEPRLAGAIEAIDMAVSRGAGLTRQLLSFSRRQTHETVVIDLGEGLPAIQGILQSSLRGDIAIDVRVPPGAWPVAVDRSEFELALLNLTVNARDAMTGGGRPTITADNVTVNETGIAEEAMCSASPATSSVSPRPAPASRPSSSAASSSPSSAPRRSARGPASAFRRSMALPAKLAVRRR